MTTQDFLSLLDKVRKTGTGWLACCPAHDDHDPSLSISEGREGRILLRCFAGCSPEEVVAALGLEIKDLFPGDSRKLASPLPRSTSPAAGSQRGKLHTTAEAAAKAAAFGLKRKFKKDYAPVHHWNIATPLK